jgi:hypothetical protein
LEEELEAIAIAHVSLDEAVLREDGELKGIRERDLAVLFKRTNSSWNLGDRAGFSS